MEVPVIIVGMNPARERNSKKNALSRLYNWLDELNLDYVSFTNLSADSEWNFDLKTVDKNFLYDQLLFRPLVAWSEKFRMEPNEENRYESWFVNLLQDRMYDIR